LNNIKTKAAISERDALQQYQQDQQAHPCEETVVVGVEEDLAAIAHTLPYPLAVMRETLTAEVAFGTVED
jgi:hypothetical protein